LKNPEKYKNFGVKLPKGVLMIGPPGVGKTLIAKAVAGEAGVPFFYQSGASFAEIFVGVGAKRVRELFAKAKAVAPSIIFIDEIDAVGKTRAKGRNDELESTLNQLLTEMDGFKENNGVIVIAATNKAEMIDTALLRAGRFDRRILIALPNFADRVEILKVYLKDKNFIGDVTKIAGICVGFSGASIATLVNEAAINAMRRNSEKIELSDFEAVKSKVLLGSKKTIALSDYEKEIQSYYQASKALTAFWFNVDFEKIGLLDEKFLNFDTQIDSKTKIINEIKVLLSGVSGLKIYKNDAFSNGSKDIKKAAFLAEKMIFDYAMGDNLIPNEREITDILENSYNEVSELLKNKGEKIMSLFKKKEEKKSCCCQCSVDAMEQAEETKKELGIKILGSGCAKCNKLEENVRQALEEMNIELPIGHVTDFAQIATYGVMSTPALVLNGEVVSFGKVLTVDEVKHILKVKL